MKLKYIFLLPFLTTAIAAQCQDKFIEVIVSDTAWVTPNQFVYTIMPNISDAVYADSSILLTPGGYEESTRRKGMQAAKMLDSLKAVLVGKGFYVLPQDVGEAYATDDYTRGNDYSLRVLTSSLDSVRVLYQLIEADASFYGRLTWRKAADEEAYQQRLLQKLMAKAQQKASGIAALSKLTLGGVLSVKEAPKETGGWVAYPPLSAFVASDVPGWHTTIYPGMGSYPGIKSGGDLYQINNTVIVRFAVQ